MIINGKLRRMLSLILIFSIAFSLIGCGEVRAAASQNSGMTGITVKEISSSPDIQDAFVEITVNPIQVRDIQVKDIDVTEIKVNPIIVKDIQSIDIQQVTINDRFVYLAYKNFVSYYDTDIDVVKLLKDIAIGTTVILVWVTLSTVGGPVGTFFGAVLCSELTPATLAAGAAIDAAVAGYKAYEEGGDLSYIIGHMINGIADGYKWAAFIAPITGAVAGIDALKAVNGLTDIPALKEVTQEEAGKIFKNLAKIIKKTPDVTDEGIKKAFLALSDSLPKEITEDLFSQIIKNQDTIISLVRKFDPFSVSREVMNSLRIRYCLQAGLKEEAADQFIKKLQNHTYTRLSDIVEEDMREHIKKDMAGFVNVFGDKLSKEFIDNSLDDTFGKELYQVIKQGIKEKKQLADLIRQIDVKGLDRADTKGLLELRFGSNSVTELYAVKHLFDRIKAGSEAVSDEDIVRIINAIIDGELKSLDDIVSISNVAVTKLDAARAVFASSINDLGLSKKSAELLDSLAASGMEKIFQSDEAIRLIDPSGIEQIIQKSMSKNEIIETFGDDVYKLLTESATSSIESLSLSSKLNSDLIKSITVDALSDKGVSQTVIDQILKGEPLEFWSLTIEQKVDISNIVADYYKSSNSELYTNFISEAAEVRGTFVENFIQKKEITTINAQYAGGIMTPAGTKAEAAKMKYGDIYMSKVGFPIFDEHAIARIESDTLTGIESQDIAWANKMYFGVSSNMPGYTWHHVEDGRTLLLVPTDLHDAYRHTGGALLLREGL